MTYAEFLERMVYDSIEPTGEIRQDIRTAQICELLASAMWAKGGGKGKQPAVEDFIIDWWNEKPKPTRIQDERDKRDAVLVSLGLNQYVGTVRRGKIGE